MKSKSVCSVAYVDGGHQGRIKGKLPSKKDKLRAAGLR
jgi:hypothetical protein